MKRIQDKTRWPRTWYGVRPWTKHSLVLLVSGLVYSGVGLSYILAPADSRSRAALSVAKSWMPIQGWGIVFLIIGLATVVSARWPPTADKWGYMILTGLSSGWSAFYFVGVIFVDTPASSLSGGCIWGLLAFMWWAISGLTNPVKVVVVRGTHEGGEIPWSQRP